jgi:hypothetical protein
MNSYTTNIVLQAIELPMPRVPGQGEGRTTCPDVLPAALIERLATILMHNRRFTFSY